MTDLSTTTDAQSQETTDGFQLVIDALKLNGIDTIFALPGIPITDLTRRAQADGMRLIAFRHEQNAGHAAAIAGFMTQTPGICLTVSAPGFLNGLTALANATTNCFPMILISGSSEREVVDLQQGDYEEMDQLAIAKPHAKAAFRVLHAEDIGVGVARAIRAAVSGRPGGVYLDLPAKLFAQSIDAQVGRNTLIKVVDPAPRQIPAGTTIAPGGRYVLDIPSGFLNNTGAESVRLLKIVGGVETVYDQLDYNLGSVRYDQVFHRVGDGGAWCNTISTAVTRGTANPTSCP
jgi:oxalyl-CoA decarboxylase